jgi:hypothetical protein
MQFKSILTAAILALSPVTGASAATFDFSYTFNGGSVVAGQLVGDIDTGDNNLVNVTGIEDFVTLDGVSTGVSFSFLNSASDESFGTGEAAVVSFDGTLLNMYACDTSSCNAVMVFNINVPSNLVQVGILGGGISANIDNPMNSSWTLTAVPSVVPLPAGGLLLLTGLGGIAALKRRKNRAA